MYLQINGTLVVIAKTAPVAKLGITGNASIGATYGALAAPVSGLIIEGNAAGIGTTGPGRSCTVLSSGGTQGAQI